jgi:L-arabinonolactonase
MHTLPAAELVLDARAEAGESPWWSAVEQRLHWVDIHGRRIHRYDPVQGTDESWTAPDVVTFVAPHAQGGFVVALGDRIVHADRFGGSFGMVLRLTVPPGGRLNDGAVDAQGRLWIGAMSAPDAARGDASLYRIDCNGACKAVLGGFRTVNGLAFAPDARTLYVSDSHPDVRTVWQYEYDLAAGAASNGRLFVDTRNLPGRPDGGCVDAEGAYWMAAVDGACLLRFDPRGGLLARLPVPVEKPSKAVFGGRDLDRLFITSLRRNLRNPDQQRHAGGLFSAQPGVQGFRSATCAIALPSG